MTRRVLIVTSSYAPAIIADMHRARHLSWELPKIGWRVEILSPDGSYQLPSCMDEDGAPFFAPGTVTHYVPGFLPGLFRFLGIGSIGWRALLPMLLAGWGLLRAREFDLVYFSTTQFPLFLLGPAWKVWLGVPFILDIHDPLFTENAPLPVWARSSLKHSLSRWLARHIESVSVSGAAGLVAVSPNYLETLRLRHGSKKPAWLGQGRQAVIPFAVSERDFEVARTTGANLAVPKENQSVRIVYVGAGGPIMHRSFQLLCRALAYLRERDPGLLAGVRIELCGTMLGWRDGDPTHLADVAHDQGVADLVSENPRRISYRNSVELLLQADGALVLGVDDSGYMPSKLFGYALSGKPLLAAIRKDSPAYMQFQTMSGLGHVIWFDASGDMPLVAAAREVGSFLHETAARMKFARRALLDAFLAPAMARRHALLFEACLADK